MPLHIQMGVVHDDGIISNHFTGLEVPTDSIENIKKAMELLGIEAYTIYSDSNRKRLYASERLQQYEENEQKTKEEHNEKMEKLLQEFKALPTVLNAWDFKHIRIQIERTPNLGCAYNPRVSSGLNVSVYIRVYALKENGQNGDLLPISIHNYLSERGAILRKRFHPNMQEDREEIALKLKEIIQAEKDIERKYNIRR